MSLELRQRLFDQLDALFLVDPHTHINPLDPASHTLADILGYHYYTELAHSAGMPKDKIEEPGISSREKIRRLIENLGPIDNTIQYSWLIEMAQAFFGLTADAVTPLNWQELYAAAEEQMAQPDWAEQVLAKSKLEAVFLTNDFDDPLDGFDTSVYIPCLRTDELVFHLAKPGVRERLTVCSGVVIGDAQALRRAIGALFTHFKGRGARACAISLPPDFAPRPAAPPGFPEISVPRRNTDLFIGRDASPAEAREMIRAYWASLTWTDWNVGRVLAELDKLGLRERIIVLFWGDHGYHLGEKGKWSKHGSLFEVGTRVPLLVAVPGAKANGTSSPRVVQALDIYPTLVELCGLPVPKGLEGHSLVPLLADAQAKWDHPAYTVAGPGRPAGVAVRTQRFRYAEYDGGQAGAMLFDHGADPHEMKNLIGEPGSRAALEEMKGVLERLLKETQ